MKIWRQPATKLVQPRQQFMYRRLFGNFKRPGADKVKVNLFAFFQIECLHQAGRKPDRQRVSPF